MITWQHLYFVTLFFVYSLMDIEKKEVSWSWLFFGIFSLFLLFPGKILTFLLFFGFFYLIYQFLDVGGADVIVLAMIGAILGYKMFIIYLLVLSVISLIRLIIGVVFQKSVKNVAFIPYLFSSYGIVLLLLLKSQFS